MRTGKVVEEVEKKYFVWKAREEGDDQTEEELMQEGKSVLKN